MSRDSVAFLSYVRFDDQHEDGRLTQFRERLSGEVRLQTGEKFEIFQDRNAIAWGEQWQQRIDESLDAVTFLIPILTPGFFKSPACRSELERFLDREKRLGRRDLILPVYYVNCPLLSNQAQLKADDLANIIASRQHADWRELRFEPFTSPQVGKTVAQLAEQIVQSLGRVRSAKPVSTEPDQAGDHSAQGNPETMPDRENSAAELPGTAQRPTRKSEPPTRVVDALHRGDHATLTDALKAAEPGDRILIRPGLYKEGIVIEKPIEVIGDGELGEVVIEANGADTVLFRGNMARIANLTLRQTGGGKWFCIDIAQGRLDVEGCDITSQSLACVAIHDGADPRLRRNRIHDGKQGGVFVYENGLGTIEDNEIFGNAQSGVAIKEGGNPTLRRNRIHDGKQGGVYVNENGLGTLEDNEIFGNALAGVQISSGGNPTLRRNRIHDGKQSGVLVNENGQGTLENNEILANAQSGVRIQDGANPTLRRNLISENGYKAIWVSDGGQGLIEDNDLRGNTRGAWDISQDCQDKVIRSRNQE
jgi:parallel beta-helix repeat protein